MSHPGISIIRMLARLLLLLASPALLAQDIEPRRWSHLPSNYSVLGGGFATTRGDVLFDPVLRIEDAKMELHAAVVSYVHAFAWLGKSARLDFTVPYVQGRWAGLLDGEFVSVRRNGIADPTIRLSINLYGAPVLKGKEFAQYYAGRTRNTVVGAAIAVGLPLGQYTSERLINLGTNRWTIRPQIGVVHSRGPWSFELTGSVFFYTDNTEFWMGTHLEQEPLWALQAHLIKTFDRDIWVSLSGGYGWGAKAKVNGQEKDNRNGNQVWALSLGIPINRQQSIKLSYVNFETQRVTGIKSDTFVLGYSYAWGR